MKKTLLLLALLFPLALHAQNGYSFFSLFNGRFYATEDDVTHERGIMSGELDTENFDLYTSDELRDLVIVPVIYDDIRLIKVFHQNGNFWDAYSFRAVKGDKNALYDINGRQLIDLIPERFGWQAEVTARPFCFVGVERPDKQGYNLHIMLGDGLVTVLKGQFDFSYYQEVVVGDINYYYIKAKKFGTEEYANYDVVGNPLTSADLDNLPAYYRKKGSEYHQRYSSIPGYQRTSDENTKLLNCAALCGDPTAVTVLLLSYYTTMKYEKVVDWDLQAEASKSAQAMYYVGLCYMDGDGTKMNIRRARDFFEQSRDLGYPKAAEKLAKIAAYDKPVSLASGPQTRVNEDLADEELRKMAYGGNIEAIKLYCNQRMLYLGDALYEDFPMVTDYLATDVLPLLLAGAQKDASCQFMLACVYAGRQAFGFEYEDLNYSFRDIAKAQYWTNKFLSNPGRTTANCLRYSAADVKKITDNILQLKQ